MNIASKIDHTLLKPDAVKADFVTLCNEAKEWHFYSVCINPFWINIAKENLVNTNIKIATVIGFPLGANATGIKIKEAEEVIKKGVDEIDMVMNIGMFKDKHYQFIIEEINKIKNIMENKTLKVIVETCLLNEEEKKDICKLLLDSQADYIKTSTGFSNSGANIEDIKLFKSILGNNLKIKASGGIRNREKAIEMINAGADRLGTSASVKIVEV